MNKMLFKILIVMAVTAVWVPLKAEIIYSDSDTMNIGEVNGQPGDMVEVLIDMANPSFEIAGISHRIIYDETLLAVDTVVCVDRGCNLETFQVNYPDSGLIWIAAITGVSNLIPMGNGPAVSMRFVINEDAPDTVAAIRFENTVFHDNAWSDASGYDLIIPILLDGNITIGSQTGVEDDGVLPQTFELSQNYPNPFNGMTTISFALGGPSRIELCVYDIIGRRVAMVFSGQAGAGKTEIIWDARSSTGAELPSGIYFYRLTIEEGKSLTRRMTLLK